MQISHSTKYSVGDRVCYIFEDYTHNDYYSFDTCFKISYKNMHSEMADHVVELWSIDGIRMSYFDSKSMRLEYYINNKWTSEDRIFISYKDARKACEGKNGES